MMGSVTSAAAALVVVATAAVVPVRVYCTAIIAIAGASLGLAIAATLVAVVTGVLRAAFTVTGATFSLAGAVACLDSRFRRVVVQCGSNGENAQGAQDNQNKYQSDLHAFSPLFSHG
ncbi:MAG TPA: hypothetical protein PLX54_10550 [Candidatus Fermentibacter daniensis]|nr:hypothetical protein [Candidatus Fermentibacter daniensis]HOR08236.1 hypothetical protein [Candidatus Fermentibacter daniensis]HPK52784.1 hypothetical protein [Candidatus Fermentibacter daniensis]